MSYHKMHFTKFSLTAKMNNDSDMALSGDICTWDRLVSVSNTTQLMGAESARGKKKNNLRQHL